MGHPNFPQSKDSPKHDPKRNPVWNHINVLITKMYGYISFYKKEFIEKTYKKDATTQPMKYATRIYSLIKSFMTLSNLGCKTHAKLSILGKFQTVMFKFKSILWIGRMGL